MKAKDCFVNLLMLGELRGKNI